MAAKQGKGRKFGRNTRSNSGKMQRIRTEKNKAKARALEAAKGMPGHVELPVVPTANTSSIVVSKNVGQWTAFAKKVKDGDGNIIGYIPGCKDKVVDYHVGYSTIVFNGKKERVYYA